LDALCKRYGVDNSNCQLRGGLLDAELLAFTYLAMTSGQDSLFADVEAMDSQSAQHTNIRIKTTAMIDLPVIVANADELAAHEQSLQRIAKQAGGKCLWEGN